jgi:protein-L-isoaspartate O-methyltransferase
MMSAKVAQSLDGAEFPAGREELVQRARRSGVEASVLTVLENMPRREYVDLAEVMRTYADEIRKEIAQSRGE